MGAHSEKRYFSGSLALRVGQLHGFPARGALDQGGLHNPCDYNFRDLCGSQSEADPKVLHSQVKCCTRSNNTLEFTLKSHPIPDISRSRAALSTLMQHFA
jgi:hypothetical protein